MQLDLSTLRTPELRRLLDTARERGQAAQSYQILQEMARRREGGERRPGSRRPAEPRVISLNLGDPLDVEDDPLDAPEPAPQLGAEPQLTPEPELEPSAGLTLDRAPRPEPRRRVSVWPLALFAVGAAAGVTFGGSYGDNSLAALSAGFEFPGMRIAAAASSPAAPETAETVQTASEASLPLDTAPEPAAPQQLEVLVAPEQPAEATPQPAEPLTVATAPVTEPAPPPEAAAEPCAAETPADRTICGSPELQRLQGDLRTAYAEALEAHADRTVLRQRQLAWRDGRNAVTNPQRLAELYEARIRKLTAATADARRQR